MAAGRGRRPARAPCVRGERGRRRLGQEAPGSGGRRARPCAGAARPRAPSSCRHAHHPSLRRSGGRLLGHVAGACGGPVRARGRDDRSARAGRACGSDPSLVPGRAAVPGGSRPRDGGRTARPLRPGLLRRGVDGGGSRAAGCAPLCAGDATSGAPRRGPRDAARGRPRRRRAVSRGGGRRRRRRRRGGLRAAGTARQGGRAARLRAAAGVVRAPPARPAAGGGRGRRTTAERPWRPHRDRHSRRGGARRRDPARRRERAGLRRPALVHRCGLRLR